MQSVWWKKRCSWTLKQALNHGLVLKKVHTVT